MYKVLLTYFFIIIFGINAQATNSLDSLANVLLSNSEEAFNNNDENAEWCSVLINTLSIDSLNLVLEKLPENTYTAFALSYFSYHYLENTKPIEPTLRWLDRAEKIAKQVKNDQLNYWIFRHKAFVEKRQGKAKEAIIFYKKSNEFAEKVNYRKGIIRNLLHIAEAHQSVGEIEKAFEYAEKNLKQRLDAPAEFGLAYAYYYLGELYMQIEDYEQANKYLLTAEKYFREFNDLVYTGFMIETRANLYIEKSPPDSALTIILQAKKLYEQEKNNYFLGNWYLSLGRIHQHLGNTKLALANTMIADSIHAVESIEINTTYQLGDIYFKKGNYQKAKEYFEEYLNILLKAKTQIDLSSTYNYLATIANKQKKYEESKELIKNGLYYAKQQNNLEDQLAILTTSYECLFQQKKYIKANKVHSQIFELSQKINAKLQKRNARNLKISYNLKNQRDQLEKEKLKTQYEKKWNNYLLVILGLGFPILLLLLMQIIRVIKNKNKILAIKNQEIAQLNENLESKVQARTNELEERTEMLNNYFGNLPGAAYRFKCGEEEFKPISISNGGKSLFGIDSNFFSDNIDNSKNLVEAEYFEEVKRKSHEFVAQKNPDKILEQIYPINVNGERKWVVDRSKILIDKNDDVYLDGILLDITNQKNFELQLATSQKELSLIYDNTPDILGLVQIQSDDSFMLESINLTFVNLLVAGGRCTQDQQFSGMDFVQFLKDYLHLNESEIVNRQSYIRTVKASLRPLNYEQVLEIGGDKIYFDVNITPIIDKDTYECSRVLFIIRNTTESVKARIALAKSEKRLSTIYNSSKDNIGLIKKMDDQYIIESFNKTALEFLQVAGLSTEVSELVGIDMKLIFEELFDLPDHLVVERMEMIRKVFEEKKTFQYRSPLIVKSKNVHLYFETIVSPVLDAYGNCTHALYTARNISESELAKQKLISSQRRLASIFNGTTDQMIILDVKSNRELIIEDTNRSFKTSWIKAGFSKSVNEFYGKSAELFLRDLMGYTEHKTKERLELCYQIIQNKKPINFEEVYEATNGQNYLFDITIVPILNKEEICTKLLLVLRDITLKHRAKEKMISKILETEDRERSRFAKELHDSLGQNLTAASLSFNFVKKNLQHMPEEAQSRFKNGVSFLKEAISESRNIAHNLMPQAISDFGFILTVESLLESLSKTTDVKFEFYNNLNGERLNPDYELGLYRITQEAINNILKHAEASNVTIQLIKHAGSVILTIEDDGKGFQYKSKSNTSFGLNSMKNRASALSGILEIDSAPGKGTFITLEIPL